MVESGAAVMETLTGPEAGPLPGLIDGAASTPSLRMTKSTSLSSVAAEALFAVTRTRAELVGGPVTVQVQGLVLPMAYGSAATAAWSTPNDAPPSRDNSTLKLVPLPRLWLHSMVSRDPIENCSALVGRVTFSQGEPRAKAPLVPETVENSSDVTRTKHFKAAWQLPAALQLSDPNCSEVLTRSAASTCQLAPPSRDSSTLTCDCAPRL